MQPAERRKRRYGRRRAGGIERRSPAMHLLAYIDGEVRSLTAAGQGRAASRPSNTVVYHARLRKDFASNAIGDCLSMQETPRRSGPDALATPIDTDPHGIDHPGHHLRWSLNMPRFSVGFEMSDAMVREYRIITLPGVLAVRAGFAVADPHCHVHFPRQRPPRCRRDYSAGLLPQAPRGTPA